MDRKRRYRSAALAALLLLTACPFVQASSHSEAPGTSKDRLADDTDLYAWVADDAPGAVTIVGNWVPLIEPNSGPNFASFDDEATYYVNIDNVGDSRKHVRFRFTFQTTRQNQNTFLYNIGPVGSPTDPNLNVRQNWTLTRVDVDSGQETVLGSGPVAPYFVGPVSMPGYADLAQASVQTLPGGIKVFVGPRDDPFFVDLAALFDLLSIRRPPGDKGKGVDGVGGFNVMSAVLQIPKEALTRDGTSPDPSRENHILGIWNTVERPQNRTLNGDGTTTNSGSGIQVSRLGMPLVNEVVIPLGMKDRFNASEPANDVAQFGAYVVDPELPKLLSALFGIHVPPAPRQDLVTVFATGVPGLNQPAGVAPGEMLRLNLTIPPAASPNRGGVLAGDLAGFPNGRRLADDVVDAELRVVAGVLVDGFNIAPNNQLGDGVDANDLPFLPYFPYVAPPHNPRDHEHHRTGTKPTRAISSREPGRPGESALRIASANPAPSAVLQYTLAAPTRVVLQVYDVHGRLVRTLIDQDAAPGTFRAVWDGTTDAGASAGRGVFFARMSADGNVLDSRKVVIQ